MTFGLQISINSSNATVGAAVASNEIINNGLLMVFMLGLD